jgi:hypothetical protein
MTLTNYPVVYIPSSAYESMKTDPNPDQTFLNQIGTKIAPRLWIGDPHIYAVKNVLQMSIIVLSKLTDNIESTEVAPIHGDQVGQPIVADASGNPTPKPSCDPNVTGVAAPVGRTDVDWIDSPAPGFASVGAWTFIQAFYFIVPVHGITGVLKLQIGLKGATVILSQVIPVLGDGTTFGQIFGPLDTIPTSDDFADTCWNNTTKQDVISSLNISAKLRPFGPNLYVFLEPKT